MKFQTIASACSTWLSSVALLPGQQQVWVPIAEAGIAGVAVAEAPFAPRVVAPSPLGALFGAPTPVYLRDGAGWAAGVDQAPPELGLVQAMTWDPAGRRIVAFCANTAPSGGTSTVAVVVYDGQAWSVLPTTNLPSARMAPAMAFDGVGNRILLFGGEVVEQRVFVPVDETWALVGSSWQRLQPPVSPPPRRGAASVYDPVRGRVVLFGGRERAAMLADTWEWDGGSWAPVPTTTVPPARERAAIGWHAGSSRVVIYGGLPASGFLGDAFAFAGADWVPVPVPTGLLPLAQPSLARQGADLVLAGSTADDGIESWLFDGAAFTLAQRPAGVPARFLPAVAWDEPRGELVRFGGQDTNAFVLHQDTWAWAPATGWRRLAPPNQPPVRAMAGMCLDATRQQLVLFGGRGAAGDLADTWTWNGSTWQAHATATAPSGRERPAMVHDPVAGTVLLHGGTAERDTWSWNGTSWTLRTAGAALPSGTPFLARDPLRSAIVLLVDAFPASAAFEWDGLAWQATATSTARLHSGLVWDPVAARLAAFGNGRFDYTGAGFVATGQPALGNAYVTATSLGRMLAAYGLSGTSSVFASTQVAGAVTHYGTACAAASLPRLSLRHRPRPGTVATFELDTGAANAPFWLVVGLQQADLPLPGGCRDLVGAVVAIAPGVAAPSGHGEWQIAIPNLAALRGLTTAQQLWTLQATGGAPTWALSRGVAARLGD